MLLLAAFVVFCAGFCAGVYGDIVAQRSRAAAVVRPGMLLERPAPFPLVSMPSFVAAEADHRLRLAMLRGRPPRREVRQ